MVPRGAPFLVMSKKTLDMVRVEAAKERIAEGAKAIAVLGIRNKTRPHGYVHNNRRWERKCRCGHQMLLPAASGTPNQYPCASVPFYDVRWCIVIHVARHCRGDPAPSWLCVVLMKYIAVTPRGVEVRRGEPLHSPRDANPGFFRHLDCRSIGRRESRRNNFFPFDRSSSCQKASRPSKERDPAHPLYTRALSFAQDESQRNSPSRLATASQ